MIHDQLMSASPAGVNLIKGFETLRLKAYKDPAKDPNLFVIGWGHTAGVAPGMVIDEAQAEAFLAQDIQAAEKFIPYVIHSSLTQGQWDALTSLCFNLRGGSLGLARIAPKLVAKLNAGDFVGGAKEILDINKSGGKVMNGLVRRRKAEYDLFMSGIGA